MYHRQHINYPLLLLVLAVLLLAWTVTYFLVNAPSQSLSSLWPGADQKAVAPSSAMVQLAPGVFVPRDYFVQEKMYHAPVAAAQVELMPGFTVPQDYYIQEKMYHAPLAAAPVELMPGFTVPQGYYIQEKMYRS